MQRVLHVVESFAAGTLVTLANLCNRLAERGYEVHIAHSLREETPPDYAKIFDERITLHKLPMARSVNPVKDLKALLNLRKLLRKLRPDVLHLHSSKAGFLGRAAVTFSGLKRRTYYCPHGIAFLRQDISPMKQKMFLAFERIGAAIGGTLVATSQSELDEVHHRVSKKRATLVENAIDTEKLLAKVAATEPHTNGVKKITVGTIGRIGPQKNPQMFAELALKVQLPNIHWIWIGDGDPEDRALLEKADVEVTGWLPHEEVLGKLASFDLYVQTSLWEGMPLSVIEAQVVGIPAVVTDIVGNRDIVQHEETGLITKSLDEMVDAIETLGESGALRHQYAEQSKQLARKRFHLDRYVDEYVAIYEQQGSK